jgi:sigma-B regulation protein RsbU (phosphoserine phosphatase)
VLYTDGVSEAAATDGALLGSDRLGQLMAQYGRGDPAQLVRRVVDSLADGSAGYRVEDDLTLMAITLTPPLGQWQFEPDLAGDGVRQCQAWLRECLAAHLDVARLNDIELIAEELLTNSARAAEGRHIRASVQCSLTAQDIALVFRDDGVPFDPLARAAPELGADAALRSLGGLGIHLVRELADDIRYIRDNEENVLEIHLARQSATESA